MDMPPVLKYVAVGLVGLALIVILPTIIWWSLGYFYYSPFCIKLSSDEWPVDVYIDLELICTFKKEGAFCSDWIRKGNALSMKGSGLQTVSADISKKQGELYVTAVMCSEDTISSSEITIAEN
jgi:hypothetical protein